MKIIVLSSPTDLQNEHDLINALFESGLEYFHLRKPEHSKEEFEAFLRGINPKFYKRISIHSNYDLIKKYNLGGIHLSEEARNNQDADEACKAAHKKRLKASISLHETSDTTGIKIFDSVFLSPVFDSISKKGYKGLGEDKLRTLIAELRTIKSLELIALGGIEENKIEKVIELGFDGLALLGAIWKDPNHAAENFVRIKSKVEQLQNG